MTCHYHTYLGSTLVEGKPASIKQLNDFTGIRRSHTCARWMSEHTLELWVL